LKDQGHQVSGSDITNHIFTEDILRQQGISIYPFAQNNIKEDMVVVIGNSFADDHIEVVQAQKLGLKCYRYYEMLALLIQEHQSVCITGTHGKTTCTGLVYTVLNEFTPSGFLIGDGHGHLSKDATNFVVEACEYKDHFLNYYPQYALVNNMELDHVDYFKDLDQYKASFESFISNVSKQVALNGDDENIMSLKPQSHFIYFGLKEHNQVQAQNYRYTAEGLEFDLYLSLEQQPKLFYKHFKLPFYGQHMLMNTLATISVYLMMEQTYDFDKLEAALKTFKGVARRFEIKEGINGNVFIDDYAHHPTAISLMIDSTRQKYPDKKIIAFFKPDRYSRIYEFGQEIGTALQKADEVYLFEFPKTTLKEEGIDITMEYVVQFLKQSHIINEDEESALAFKDYTNCIFLMMSSKNVYDFRDLVINKQEL
ncbi:MAG: UDP-N-acetylmuramate--L-alanine ligase, partial [Bacilli bacterium]